LELYLIRHTAPAIEAGICYGRSDVDVTLTFDAEAEIIGQKLTDCRPAVIYTSPSQRCAKLAHRLVEYGLCELVIEDDRLMELHFGQWEMTSWDEIDLAALERWGASYIHHPPPSGETFLNLHQRVTGFLSGLNATSAEPVVVITHAGVIRALFAEAMALPLNEAFNFELDYGGITRLIWNGETLQMAASTIEGLT
jgi:alpha-ribazole phosphatase